MSKVELSYHDAIIYADDLKILKSETEWLNDRIISFYFEYLSNEIYADEERILLIGPEVTQAIKMMGNSDEVKAVFLDPLNAISREFIIFALNDNSLNSAGGSHWSLCVYSKPDNSFFHFDSSLSLNSSSCSKLVKILRSCLGCESAKIENVTCLQQNNGYDCGIFVLCHADLACQAALKEKSLKEVKKLQPKKVHIKRNEVVQIILNLSSTD